MKPAQVNKLYRKLTPHERKRSTQTHIQGLANTFFSDRTQAGKKIIVTTGRLGIIDSRY